MSVVRTVLETPAQTVPCLHLGGDGRRALLLHGFPDSPWSMVPLMEALGRRGWSCWAPWMPGFDPAVGAPATFAGLARFVLDLLDALGGSDVVVLGHDWGAVAVYAACATAPARVWRAVALSVPPVRVFLRNALRSPEQMQRSSYLLFFQLPRLPEVLLARRGARHVERLWRRWSAPGATPDAVAVREARRALASYGAARRTLAYYRHLTDLVRGRPRAWWDSWRLASRRLGVPTCVVTGAEDGCIGVEAFEELDTAFLEPPELHVIPGAGHFVQLDAAEAVAGLVDAFVEGAA